MAQAHHELVYVIPVLNYLLRTVVPGRLQVLQLELWTTKSAAPSSVLRVAALSLLAGLEARKEKELTPELKPIELLMQGPGNFLEKDGN